MQSEDRIPEQYKGFLYRKSSGSLILNSGDFNRAAKIMKKDKILNLEININFFNPKEISFLKDFQFIRGLNIISPNIMDISPIQRLEKLHELSIEYMLPGEIYFYDFKTMKNCSFVWGIKHSDSIFHLNALEELTIYSYSKSDVFYFSGLQELKSLSLINSKISNLIGINHLRIKKLNLTGSIHLDTIKDLGNHHNLKELRLDYCKGINDLNELKYLKNLRVLSFNNIGRIPTLNNFENLLELEEIYFTDDTFIEDGDLNPLKYLYQKGRLNKIIFKNRTHYTQKREDLGYKRPESVARVFRKK